MNVSRALKRLSKVLYAVSGLFLILTAWYLFYHTEQLLEAYDLFAIALIFWIIGWITDDLAT